MSKLCQIVFWLYRWGYWEYRRVGEYRRKEGRKGKGRWGLFWVEKFCWAQRTNKQVRPPGGFPILPVKESQPYPHKQSTQCMTAPYDYPAHLLTAFIPHSLRSFFPLLLLPFMLSLYDYSSYYTTLTRWTHSTLGVITLLKPFSSKALRGFTPHNPLIFV